MNTSTDTPDHHADPDLDAKITSMLDQIDAATPTAPAFDDLVRGPAAIGGDAGRPNWMTLGAAASIVAIGVGGLVLLGTRDGSEPAGPAGPVPSVDGGLPTGGDSVPLDERSADSTPDAADSEPTEELSVGTEPPIEPDREAPQPIGLGDPLLGAALPADATPMFEVGEPNWAKDYVYGTDELPLGDTRTTSVVLVGDDGPIFDQPMVALSVFDATGTDISTFGEPIEIDGVIGSVTSLPTDPESGLAGPIVNLTIPLDDGLALTVNSVRLGVDDTAAIAATVDASASRIELTAPDGFRQLPGEVPETWRNFSYRWAFDDGTGVPEPVVVSTPDAIEEVDQVASIEVVGSNLGPIGLASRISQEVGVNRVVNGIDVAFRPMPSSPGSYWVDWIDGDWSYYAIGVNLDSEEQFLDLLASLRLADAETFATADGIDVVVPGDQSDLAADILGDIDLTSEQIQRAAAVSMPTSRGNYEFELYLGLGCTAATAWLDADADDDEPGRESALAAVEAAIARPDNATGLPSRMGLETLADPMRGRDADSVAEFGSNDCPLWSGR